MKKSVLNGLLALGALACAFSVPAMAQDKMAPKMDKMAPKMSGKMAPKMSGKMAPKMSGSKMAPAHKMGAMKPMTGTVDGKKVTCKMVNGKMVCQSGNGKMMPCKTVNGKMMVMKGGKMVEMKMDHKMAMSHSKMAPKMGKMSDSKMAPKMSGKM